jgi:hypothetical protein
MFIPPDLKLDEINLTLVEVLYVVDNLCGANTTLVAPREEEEDEDEEGEARPRPNTAILIADDACVPSTLLATSRALHDETARMAN